MRKSRAYRRRCIRASVVCGLTMAVAILASLPIACFAQEPSGSSTPAPPSPDAHAGAQGTSSHAGHDGLGGVPGAHSQELLFFVSGKYTRLQGLETSVLEHTDFLPTVDIFYSRSAERFRMLAEYLVTDEEHDLERFQVGWQVSGSTRFWLGRFHQSATFWNTEHHHGQFLQTSINRPAIEEWEDLGGVLPSHTSGFLLEHQQELGEKAGLQLSFSGGLTGVLVPQQIEPYDLLNPENGHGQSMSLRAAFFPDFLGDDQIGITYAVHGLDIEPGVQLPATWNADVDKVDVTSIGLYAIWGWNQWRLSATADQVQSLPTGGLGGRRTTFVASYAQTEYRLDDKWTVFARVETTSGEEDYLELFPRYVRSQGLVGARWLIAPSHALSIELADGDLHGDRFHRIALQWSAVVP
jgi:hypothetical protein